MINELEIKVRNVLLKNTATALWANRWLQNHTIDGIDALLLHLNDVYSLWVSIIKENKADISRLDTLVKLNIAIQKNIDVIWQENHQLEGLATIIKNCIDILEEIKEGETI